MYQIPNSPYLTEIQIKAIITGGDQDFGFKATAIEFYGVKTKAR